MLQCSSKTFITIDAIYFLHEKSFPEYNSNGQKLNEFKSEYQAILSRLDALEEQEIIGAIEKRL